LREKDLSGAQQKQLASALLPVTHAFGARLTIHGDPDMAADAGLDGVHLKAGGIVGVSIHSVAEARALDPMIVDYAIAGPVYATSSKPGYGPAFGPGGLRSIVDASRVPIVGIGGIEANRVGDLIAAGAAGIAVMGGVMRAQDPGVEVRRLLAALASAQPRPR
jgi:thiamine-phosphate pyrophosphorylase